MKQNREHGKKKLATKILSFILALVFVFSIFSGMASAECVLRNEEVLSEKFVATADPVVTEKQWQITSITCEQANWKGTITTETKGNIEKTVKRTYECCCEVTGECADEDETLTEKTPYTKTETKPDTATTGATCPKPCATKEQIEAAEKALEAAIKNYEKADKAYRSALEDYDINQRQITEWENVINLGLATIQSTTFGWIMIQDIILGYLKSLKFLEKSFKFLKLVKIFEKIEEIKKFIENQPNKADLVQKQIDKLTKVVIDATEERWKCSVKKKNLEQKITETYKEGIAAGRKKKIAYKSYKELMGYLSCAPVPQEHPDCSYNINNFEVHSHLSDINKNHATFYAQTSGNLNTTYSSVPIDSTVSLQDHPDIVLFSSSMFENDTLHDSQYDGNTTSAYHYTNLKTVTAFSTEFAGDYSDYGTDVDGDGLYDFLSIEVGVNVTAIGNYTIIGWLHDVNGNEIVWSINDTSLGIGNQTIILNFDGKAMQKHGVNGPYYLKDLVLFNEHDELLGYIVDAYTTLAYDYTDFQTLMPPVAQFTGDYSDYGIDIDSNGLYDYLVMGIEVNVTIAGNYTLSGLLYDVNGNELVWADNDTYLPIGDQTMKVHFDSKAIQNHGVNGPYYLKTLTLFDENYELLDYIVDAYTTSAYDYTDFQILIQPTQFTGDYSDYGTDIDGDELYDYLTIDVGINVTTAGNYTVSGCLYDVNGNEIVWAGNDTYLNIGNQTVEFNFDGKIIQNHGVNGPYYLKNITLSDENYKIVDYILDAYATSAYEYTDFQTLIPPTQFTGDYSDYGMDIDGDGLYDYLTIDVGVNVTSAGNYSISGGLYDANAYEIVWSFNDTDLYVGIQTVKLNFDGKAIRKYDIDGPYYLKNLTLINENRELADLIVDAYTTSEYDSVEFQIPPAAAFTGIYSDGGRDINSDGLYNYLTIDVDMDATVAGNYSIEGWLYDVNGTDIVWSSYSAHLNIGNQTVGLNFDGKDIHEHGVDGSYYLKNLVLFDENSAVLGYVVDAYTTSAYNYTDFQTPPSQFTDTYLDYGTDIDGDGLYDYLTTDVGVKVTSAGNYSVEGLLYDVNGSIVVSTSNDTHLDVGVRSVLLNFDGLKIRRHGVNAPFNLSHLILYDKNSNLLEYRDFAYTTSAYNYSEFKMGFIGMCSDYGIDVDTDGLYDYLTIDVSVNVTTPGNYSLMGYLYDVNETEIVWSIDYRSLSAGNHTMHLDFSGKTIQMHGVNGPYYLKHLRLSGENWTFIDYIPDAYNTSAYNYTDFVDPVSTENEVTISGVGLGQIRLIVSFKDTIPVFAGRYSYDLVGINIPQRPNNFTITASAVKNLKLGLKKIQDNTTRIWVTQTIAAPEGRATAQSDLPSPGNYHVKIFGDAAEEASEVDMVLTAVKKIKASGDFSLSIDISGFPAGKYTITAKALNGCFTDLTLDGLPLAP